MGQSIEPEDIAEIVLDTKVIGKYKIIFYDKVGSNIGELKLKNYGYLEIYNEVVKEWIKKLS